VRPLRAIVDFDEAWIEARRSRAGNPEHALKLLMPLTDPSSAWAAAGAAGRLEPELRQRLEHTRPHGI